MKIVIIHSTNKKHFIVFNLHGQFHHSLKRAINVWGNYTKVKYPDGSIGKPILPNQMAIYKITTDSNDIGIIIHYKEESYFLMDGYGQNVNSHPLKIIFDFQNQEPFPKWLWGFKKVNSGGLLVIDKYGVRFEGKKGIVSEYISIEKITELFKLQL